MTDRRALMVAGLALGLGLTSCGAPPTPPEHGGGGRPGRIVSLTPCLDAILVEVADRNQIAAISHYSRDRYGSTIADLAQTLPIAHGTAEEVVALSPDLVLAGRPASPTLMATLGRLSIRTTQFPVPETVAASLQQVRDIAALVGWPERGEALVGKIEAALTAAEAPQAPRLSALVFMPGGFVSAPGTLMDEMMRRAGLQNAAAKYGLRQSMSLPLEVILADPPDILLSGQPLPGAPSRAERLVAHPAFKQVAGQMKRIVFPERLLFCGGPVLIQTAAALARARDTALGRPASPAV